MSEVGKKRIASCCCGTLQAETEGEPIVIAACSCEQCQKRSGSPFGVSTFWPKSKVTVQGDARSFTRDGQEGRKVTLYFCPTCGSTLYWLNPERRPDSIAIGYGAFRSGEFPAPSVSVWEERKHDWVTIPAHQSYPRNPG
jgi:hypothetical protein